MWTGKRLIAYCSTHICGTSRQLITEYGFGARRFGDLTKAACYCGIDTSRFVGDAAAEKASVCREFSWPGDAKIILVAGRMDVSTEIGHRYNHKNSAFAVSVAIQCARQDSRVHALFAGWRIPTVVSVLEQRIAAQGLAERIQFVGVRRDIERLMLASDVLLFPSRAEGLGMVAVEAQAAGLPVLASTAVPRECLVVPELVQFRDVNAGKEAEWAANLLQLAAQPRNIIYANQRVAASEFAIEHSALTLLRLYSKGCRFQKPDLGVPVI